MILCQNCQKSTKNPKFCSRSCSVAYNNSKQPKRQRVNKPCIQCNKPVSKNKCKHCSHECLSKTRWQQRVKQIKESGILHPKGYYHSSKFAKKYLIETQGPNCSICGHQPLWNGKHLIMILDHINGVPDDWRIENIRLVCPNCDTQLSTFKSKNKNGGRPNR